MMRPDESGLTGEIVAAKPRIIVTRRWPDAVETVLRSEFDVVLNADDKPMTTAELQRALGEADALCPTVSDSINAEVLSAEPLQARILGSYGVGFNHIDLDAAKALGLIVTNTPEVLTDCTADLAMTLLMMIARRAGEGERHVRSGAWTGWRPTHMMGTKVTGKTLGLIGMGRIARAMAHKAHHGFGMKIIFNDPYPPPPEVVASLGAESRGSVEEVLKEADFVSLHCPGGKETWHLLNAERLALMKPTAFLVNSARGDVVDQQALIAALRGGVIAGAALDVYEGEPKVPPELLSMENVVLLPHLGSASTETRVAMGMRVIDNLRAFFGGREPRDRVA
jgi:lactate dehydrogenase-like 2-hydroxyacid dehydrogenase